jgi:hypothetical protein
VGRSAAPDHFIGSGAPVAGAHGRLPAPPIERSLPGAVPPERMVNHGKNVAWQPRYAFRPGRDIEDLSAILKWVSRNLPPDIKVKAGGSTHSWSPVAASSGVYIHPEGMRFIEAPARPGQPGSVLRPNLPPDQAAHLVRIGAGTTIREINRELWGRGLALPVLGGFDGQTLGGVLPTGTHGSVLKHGPLAEMVQSLDLVKPDGTKVRIEPRNGITDPAAFKKQFPGWELRQDDAVFNAALVNMGTMGVVHSYTVRATDKFYLNEVRTQTTGREAQRILRGGNLYNLMESDRKPAGASGAAHPTFAGHPKPAHHLELLWNPYSDNLIVTSRHPVDASTQRNLARGEPEHFKSGPPRDLFRALALDQRLSRNALPEWLTGVLGRAPTWAMERLVEVFPKAVPWLVDQGMNTLPDKAYTNRSYNVYNIGDAANLLPAQSATISVPLRGDRYLRAMDILRETARTFAEKHRMYETGPISMRFVKGSEASLADPEDVCKFEIIFGGDNEQVRNLSKELTGAFYEALRKELGPDVRLHWGQLVPEQYMSGGEARLRESYPKYEEWRRIRNEFDPQRRFVNEWQQRLLG